MSRCRSCGAEITWIRMKSGKWAPCNMPPQYFTRDKAGRYTYITPDGNAFRGEPDTSGEIGYTSHFATCPYAEKYRKNR